MHEIFSTIQCYLVLWSCVNDLWLLLLVIRAHIRKRLNWLAQYSVEVFFTQSFSVSLFSFFTQCFSLSNHDFGIVTSSDGILLHIQNSHCNSVMHHLKFCVVFVVVFFLVVFVKCHMVTESPFNPIKTMYWHLMRPVHMNCRWNVNEKLVLC